MSKTGDLLSEAALTVYRLNGQFLGVGDALARPVGMTVAWWQVLSAVLDEPMSVAGIARLRGLTRQGVQRVADLLVAEGLAEYEPNPAHRRAKLLRPTARGTAAIERIGPDLEALANRVIDELGPDGLEQVIEALKRLSAALDRVTRE
ncbi:MarR family winged helix-turn-helix transcriptional regulator [Planobispora longispora]|uniref:MarR family transcriptional regulator n=1 Tax=Planobispora longispora TaxID=28887 RepID=A0A8J3RSN4_9ACTN|nr:helix-turn-helix domain-containing protein [Planobispora longispora]BFE80440.1 MarR family transcriptional regulator [Planobispora longispora]GIH79152.1 MarR family transcriptional regulator [Planobispora longispora]